MSFIICQSTEPQHTINLLLLSSKISCLLDPEALPKSGYSKRGAQLTMKIFLFQNLNIISNLHFFFPFSPTCSRGLKCNIIAFNCTKICRIRPNSLIYLHWLSPVLLRQMQAHRSLKHCKSWILIRYLAIPTSQEHPYLAATFIFQLFFHVFSFQSESMQLLNQITK